MFFFTFSCGFLGQVWHLIVLIPDLCHLYYLKCILLAPRLDSVDGKTQTMFRSHADFLTNVIHHHRDTIGLN